MRCVGNISFCDSSCKLLQEACRHLIAERMAGKAQFGAGEIGQGLDIAFIKQLTGADGWVTLAA